MDSVRGVLVYDGDCGFCTKSADLLDRRVRPDASIVAWQHTDLDRWGLTPEEAAAAVQWVSSDGVVASGHRAVANVLGQGGPGWRLLGRILLLPGVSWVAEKVYGWVAAHRYRLPGGTPACRMAPEDRPGAGS
jgi:predicted DCC family thiol-disulfide oxidoreductase YuxK